jgi:hypothetical protein
MPASVRRSTSTGVYTVSLFYLGFYLLCDLFVSDLVCTLREILGFKNFTQSADECSQPRSQSLTPTSPLRDG